MTDLEKLIAALGCTGNECENCPYHVADSDELGTWGWCDEEKLHSDAIALLREQEPVPFDEIGYQPVCGVCHESLDVTDEYCRHCGRKVRWKCD